MVPLNRTLLTFSLSLLALHGRAQGSYADRARDYIATYKDLAIAEQRRTGVPAAITLAQGIYETSAGASELATEANNHFGIKCKRDWTGATFAHTDDAPNECFRKYPSAQDSYRDHSDYLRKTPRYAALFRLAPADYVAWATELKRAGYATNPKYAQLLSRVVEDFGLQDYTYVALKTSTSETVALFTPEVVPTQDAPVAKAATPPPAPVVKAAPLASYMEYLNGLQGFYAKAGDMLLNAAMRYNVRYAKLLEWNDLHDAPLPFDQFIYLEKKPTRGGRPMHVVRSGETVLQVAQAEGIQLASLRALNQLEDGEEPVAGTTLYLMGGAPIKPRTYHPEPAVPVATETPAPAVPAAATPDGTIATTKAARIADSAAPVVATTAPTDVPPPVVTTPATTPADAAADSVKSTDTTPLTAAAASTDPLERLKARMDKAVYAPAKPRETPATAPPAKTAAATTPGATPKTAVPAKGAQAVQAAAVKPATVPAAVTVPAAAAPKTTVSAALPKPKKDTVRSKVVVPPAAGGARTVSAALPKDMQPAAGAAPATQTAPAGNVEFHTVGRGETVFSIAKRYGVSVTDLQTWNQLDFAAIRVGQQLRVKKP